MHEATSIFNVDNEVINTPAESNQSIPCQIWRILHQQTHLNLRFMTKVIMQLTVHFLILCDPL